MGKASKRQQRAREQLEELGFSTTKDSSLGIQNESEEEEETQPSRSHFSTAINTFASLGGQDQSGEDSQEENSEAAELSVLPKKLGPRKKAKSKKKSKNKSSNATPGSNKTAPDSFLSSPDPIDQFNHEKTDLGQGLLPRDEEVDEIEKALKELGLTDSTLNVASQSLGETGSLAETLSRICSVDCKMLDSDQELRRVFGSRVISSALNSTRSSPTPYHPRISNNPHHQVNLQSKNAFLARSQPTWPRFDKTSVGLSMRALSEEETADNAIVTCPQDTWFTFEHNSRFKATQSKFIQAIMSHDPNRLMPIFQGSPYHPDTLLQLSDVSAQQGDPGQALDFLNRALFSFEKCFSPLFNLSRGLVRLNFMMVENRGFYRAIEKSMQLLAKRGCWRTAFETCKLLFAINPYQDPYGALLWIDFLAPKAKQYQYFLDLAQDYPVLCPSHSGIPTTEYPGFAYATALCMWHLEEENNQSHDNSSKALQTAIVRFPQVMRPLGDKIGLSLPASFSTVERALPRQGFVDKPGHVIHLQSHIYVTRSGDLWKEPGVLSWIQTVVSQCHHRLNNALDPDVILGQQYTRSKFVEQFMMGIYRTVILSDIQTLKVFLSPAFIQSTCYSFDPLPPASGSTYDVTYFNDATLPTERQQGQGQFLDGGRDRANVEEGAFRELFNQILQGAAGIEGRNPRHIREQIERLQLTLQADDGNLNPEQREALLELLDALLMQLGAEQDSDEGEEDVDNDADNLPAEQPVPVGQGHAGASSDELVGDTSEVIMPGAFHDEEAIVDHEHPPDQSGVMNTIWRWIGQR